MTDILSMTTPQPDRAEAALPATLEGWVALITDQGMPVFHHAVKKIAGITSDRESSAAELAAAVLQDAAMTSRLLRVANSPVYNPTGKPVSTVTRAVVRMGFDTVRSLCLSLAVVEAVARGATRDRLAREMARCFHAAVQARAFAEQRGDGSPEEVFIAALLKSLGRLALWCLGGEAAGELALAGNEDEEKARLGVTARALTLALVREWKLGRLLEHAVLGQSDEDPRVSNVMLAHELAAAVERGWENPALRDLLRRVAENCYLPLREARALVEANAQEAARVAGSFGLGRAGMLIPLPKRSGQPGIVPEPAGETAAPRGQDKVVQLEILREIMSAAEGGCEIHLVLEMVLEGFCRGLGMDRALFALLSTDRRRLQGRHAIGVEAEAFRQGFRFEISPLDAHLYQHVIVSGEPLWYRPGEDARLDALATPEVLGITDGQPFFAAPIRIGNRTIGLFHADRAPSGRALDADLFDAFCLFGQTANLCLTHLRQTAGAGRPARD